MLINRTTVSFLSIFILHRYTDIIRSKYINPEEFGARDNMLDVDSINFSEHRYYDKFNGGTRLQSAIHYKKDILATIIK